MQYGCLQPAACLLISSPQLQPIRQDHKAQFCGANIYSCSNVRLCCHYTFVPTSSAGACFGAGVDIITACDIRYSTEAATFCVKVSSKAFSRPLQAPTNFALVFEPRIMASNATSIATQEGHPNLCSLYLLTLCICRKWMLLLLLMWALCRGYLPLLDKVCISCLHTLSKQMEIGPLDTSAY